MKNTEKISGEFLQEKDPTKPIYIEQHELLW